MSRFFRSTSDSESESDSELSQITSEDDFSDQEESSENEQEQEDQEAPRRSRFLRGEADSDDSDEDGGKRQVKSQKDKRIEGLQAIVKSVENGQKNNDWGLIASGTGLHAVYILFVCFSWMGFGCDIFFFFL